MKAVIFDVDGVIVDVRNSYHHAIKETVKHFTGKNLSLEFIREFKFSRGINNDWDVSVELIKHLNFEPPPYDDLVEVFENYYDQLKDKEELILDKDFFKDLKESGLILGVVTGRPKRDLKYLFDRFQLWEFFDAIIDDDDVGDINLRKPHPFPLHLCMESLGAKEGIYIGDNNADYEMVKFYKKIYGKPMEFIHFKKVFQENLPADFSTDSEEDLKEYLKVLTGLKK
ncbi:MAG TPA: HAD family hydrolase [Aquifex aeolicus]|nr:HAD family hydrolase [Aquifex aeolicus]